MRPFKPILGICTITNELSRLITHDLKSNSQLGSFHDSMLFMMLIVPAVLQSVSSPLMARSQAHNQDTGGQCGKCMLNQKDSITNHAQHHAEKIGHFHHIHCINTIYHIYIYSIYTYIYTLNIYIYSIYIYILNIIYIYIIILNNMYLPTTIVQINYHSENMWWVRK